MSEKITFYYNPRSRGRVVHWMLEEVRANYETKVLQWDKNEQKSAEFLKINPMGKVPAIIHKGVVVTETAAICAYLADVFPISNMAPAITDARRGAYYRWLFFASTCLEPAMLDKVYPRAGNPESSRLGHGNVNDVIKTIEGAISYGYLLKDQFTAADLYLSSSLEWYIFTKTLEPKPVFMNYIKLCQDRPAFKKFSTEAGSFT